MLNEVVIPLLTVSTSSLLAISTLLDGGNHYTKMLKLKDATGNQVFDTYEISLVCDECKKDPETQHLCTHKLDLLPRWLSSGRVETVRSLLGEDPVRADAGPVTHAHAALPASHILHTSACAQAMFLRETMGLSVDSSAKSFSSASVNAFIARPRVSIHLPPDFMNRERREITSHIFTAVDPCGGGASAFSIASICVLPSGSFVVSCHASGNMRAAVTHCTT